LKKVEAVGAVVGEVEEGVVGKMLKTA